ncbi:MAG: SDR family oxidoreductase [Brevundimonas sp.]
MKILVAGATGKTGLRLVHELAGLGHHPVALARDGSDTSALPSGATVRRGDLTDLGDDVCDGCEAVVFAAGAGGGADAATTDRVDRDGAIRLIDLAAAAKVGRFVMLSSVGAGDPDPDSDLAHYLQAKHAADEHLKASGLDYAIVRPVALTEDEGQRDIRFGEAVDVSGKAARGDVAAVLATALTDAAWRCQTRTMESVPGSI